MVLDSGHTGTLPGIFQDRAFDTSDAESLMTRLSDPLTLRTTTALTAAWQDIFEMPTDQRGILEMFQGLAGGMATGVNVESITGVSASFLDASQRNEKEQEDDRFNIRTALAAIEIEDSLLGKIIDKITDVADDYLTADRINNILKNFLTDDELIAAYQEEVILRLEDAGIEVLAEANPDLLAFRENTALCDSGKDTLLPAGPETGKTGPDMDMDMA